MNEQVFCPGGCGKQVHRRASECTHCGYRAEISNYQEQLSSLSTICSILTGFGLASLVSLAAAERRLEDTFAGWLAVALFLFSSLLLLAILVAAEVLRRQELSDMVIAMPTAERERFAQRCERLLNAFALALVVAALGVVLLGFGFSIWHGLIAIVGVVVGSVVVIRVLR